MGETVGPGQLSNLIGEHERVNAPYRASTETDVGKLVLAEVEGIIFDTLGDLKLQAGIAVASELTLENRRKLQIAAGCGDNSARINPNIFRAR